MLRRGFGDVHLSKQTIEILYIDPQPNLPVPSVKFCIQEKLSQTLPSYEYSADASHHIYSLGSSYREKQKFEEKKKFQFFPTDI